MAMEALTEVVTTPSLLPSQSRVYWHMVIVCSACGIAGMLVWSIPGKHLPSAAKPKTYDTFTGNLISKNDTLRLPARSERGGRTATAMARSLDPGVGIGHGVYVIPVNDMGIPDGFGEDLSFPNVVSSTDPSPIGSALIGGLVSTLGVLNGMFSLVPHLQVAQIYLYFMHYSEDGLTTKVLVSAICVSHLVLLPGKTDGSARNRYAQLLQITNYGVPTSLNYIVWSLPASVLVNVLVVSMVQCFFAHQIYHLSSLSLWSQMVGDRSNLTGSRQILFVLAQFGGFFCWDQGALITILQQDLAWEAETVILEFIDHNASVQTQITFYDVTPAWATIVVAEVLITVSLCVLLYNRDSGSVLPRTKRLVNTLIIYAVNRCLLTSLVAIADLIIAIEVQDTWSIGLDFIIGKLYANSLLASLNSRGHLRSQDASTVLDLRIGTVHFATLPTLPGDVETSKDGVRQFDMPEMTVADNTTDLAFNGTTEL
ncbi:hypothetical protein F5141DRAFT_1061622 [Pisolithus sp. B1]|nr:hypothetical protein F5141DRAFT_1061622 [Pisolithus sp. B1]